jgi:hypothetical protein
MCLFLGWFSSGGLFSDGGFLGTSLLSR